MRGLRLEDVTVAGVPGFLNLAVELGEIRAVIVPDSPIRAVADVLVGLAPPQSGQATVDDKPITDNHRRTRERGVRLVPSDGGLMPNLTVLRNILYTECVVEGRPSQIREQVVRHSTAVAHGLNDVLDRFPYEITIGRRRTAGLARALWANPSLVVLEDDPHAPTWVSQLGVAQPPPGHDLHLGPAHTPARLLSGVATVLIASAESRTKGLDTTPARFEPGPRDGRRE